jgi:hypothetical protein
MHPRSLLPRLRRIAAGLLLLLTGPALAHDTWFERRPDDRPPALLLGTGDRFPTLESRVEPEHLQDHGCAPQATLAAGGRASAQRLVPVGGPAGRLTQALVLRLPAAAARPGGAAVPHTCWASLVPFDIEIEPAKVDLYLKEIAAGDALRAAWAAEQAAGRAWRERYTKHARIDLGALSPQPIGLALEALPLDAGPARVGQPLRLELRHAGRPLADHPVELVTEASRLGLWRRTDAEGRIALALPLPGRWLLRSTLLRAPARPGARWESDFVTLAFDVEPAAAAPPR